MFAPFVHFAEAYLAVAYAITILAFIAIVNSIIEDIMPRIFSERKRGHGTLQVAKVELIAAKRKILSIEAMILVQMLLVIVRGADEVVAATLIWPLAAKIATIYIESAIRGLTYSCFHACLFLDAALVLFSRVDFRLYSTLLRAVLRCSSAVESLLYAQAQKSKNWLQQMKQHVSKLLERIRPLWYTLLRITALLAYTLVTR